MKVIPERVLRIKFDISVFITRLLKMAGFIQVYILSVYVLLLWYCIQEYHARMVHLFSISLKSDFLGRDYLVVRFTSTCSTNDYKHKH